VSNSLPILALVLAFASPASLKAQSTAQDACSYVSDAQVAAVLHGPVEHAAISAETCVYATTRGPREISFITVIAMGLNGVGAEALFDSWRKQAGSRARAIDHVWGAYTIGTSVIALHRGKIVITTVSGQRISGNALRAASIEIALPVLSMRENHR
jgi:hypothetical protein